MREREFVLAAQSIGARDRRIIFKHIFPNIFGELLVAATLWVGVAIRLEANLAFILNPTKIEQVRQVATNSLIMPRKSTYFYPKVMTGLVMNPLE